MELHAVKTFYTDQDGLVTLEDDVLSIVRQVREQYGNRVNIRLEPTTGQYVFSENCADGTERLIFASEHLDQRDLDRLMQADSTLRGYEDTYEKAEREQDEDQAQMEKEMLEELREQGERLAHALRQDGVDDSLYPAQTVVPRDLSG
jgi:hypothetical protein